MRRVLLVCTLGPLFAAALYASVFTGEFQFDDQSSLVENVAVHSHDPAQVYRFWPGRYLAYQSLALQHALWGLDPVPYHAFNALVHGLAASLCTLWIYALLGPGVPARRRRAAALFGGLLFLCHPIQTQAVSYVVQRAASMAACFALGSMAAYCAALRSERRAPLFVIAWLAALAAMFSKEFAIVLPLAILLCDFAIAGPSRRWPRLLPFALLLPVVPLVAVSKGAFGVAGSEGLLAETAKVTRLDYARTQCEALARYLRLIVLPYGQNVDHHLPWHGERDWFRTLTFATVPMAILLFSFWSARRGRGLSALAGALFLLFMAPESSVFPIQDAMFEHRLYLPMAAVALLIASALPLQRRAVLIGASAGILILSTLTIARNRVWSTPLALWSDAAAKSPEKGRPHVALGVELAQARQFDAAMRELELGLRLEPNSARGWTNLGNLRLLRGDSAGAQVAYERALRIRPSHANAWYNLGVVHDRQGEWDRAASSYERCLESNANHTGALNALAALRLRQGRLDEARRLAQRAAALGAPARAILDRL